MRSLPSTRARTATTARIVGIVIAALALPALVLLVITSIVMHDAALLTAALALFTAAAGTGILANLFVLLFDLPDQDGGSAAIVWPLALVGSGALVCFVMSRFSSLWLRSTALQDALAVEHLPWSALLLVGAAIASFLLAISIGEQVKQPVVIRHRRGLWTEHTLLGVGIIVAIASVVASTTRMPRFADPENGDVRAELPVLAREASRYQNHFLTQYRYGNSLTRSRQCRPAIAPLERARALAPNDGGAAWDLGYALTCSQRFGDAVIAFRDGVRLMPDSLRVHLGLAWALEHARDGDGAADEYRRILFRWPREPVATARLTLLRYDAGDQERGLAEMRALLARADSNYWVRISAAQMFASAALLKDAVEQYRWLAARDSADGWAWTQYASTAYLANELEEARRAFAHVDTMHPGLVDQVPEWRAERDAANRGIAPSALPPIQPYNLHSDSLGVIRVQTAP